MEAERSVWMPTALLEEVDLGLPRGIESTLRGLRTPARIQNFINRIPWNYQENGHTARSVLGVLEHNVAHCIEAAFVGGRGSGPGRTPPPFDGHGSCPG